MIVSGGTAPPDDIDAVAAFRTRHDLPGLADVHTHFAPPNVEAKVFAVFDGGGPMIGREWPIAYRVDLDSRVQRLRHYGVRRFTSMVYPHRPGMAQWLNAFAADFAARVPECARTATFYPEPGAAAYVGEAVTTGARVFKSHLQVGDYDPLDPLLDDVWGLLADAGVPTVIHGGHGPVAGRFTGVDRIARLLDRHPLLPLVIAHMGMPEFEQFLDLADRHERVWLDTTMNFTDFMEAQAPFPKGLRPRLADLADRIVLGSDLPTIPYPYAHQLESLERLDLGSDWIRAVCWDNGIRLLGTADD